MDASVWLKSVQATPKTSRFNTAGLWVDSQERVDGELADGAACTAFHWPGSRSIPESFLNSLLRVSNWYWCVNSSIAAVHLSVAATWLAKFFMDCCGVMWKISHPAQQQQNKTGQIATRWEGAGLTHSYSDYYKLLCREKVRMHKWFTPT